MLNYCRKRYSQLLTCNFILNDRMVTLRLKEEQMSAALKRLLLLVCLPPGTSLEKLPASMAMSTLRLDGGLSYSNVM